MKLQVDSRLNSKTSPRGVFAEIKATPTSCACDSYDLVSEGGSDGDALCNRQPATRAEAR